MKRRPEVKMRAPIFLNIYFSETKNCHTVDWDETADGVDVFSWLSDISEGRQIITRLIL